MEKSAANLSSRGPDRPWPKIISSYRKPNRVRSVFELAVTLVPFIAFWTLACLAVHFGIWWGLLLTIPAAGFLLRLFMIQHDCGHGAFFAYRHADDWIGRLIGVLTLTPYDYWRRAHAAHHATAGNLDERGVGDITTRTVAEYRALSPLGPPRLQALPQSRHHVRRRSDLAVPVQAASALRHDALRRRALGFDHGDQSRASRSWRLD